MFNLMGLQIKKALLGASILAATLATSAYAQVQSSIDPQILEDLVAANKILAAEGILDGWGHVSVRNPKDPTHFFMARNLAAELVTAKDILEFDLNSVPINGSKQALYTERFIHSEIYKAHPQVNAVVHTHAPPLIPFTVTNVALKPVYHRAAFVAQGVPLFDIADEFGMTDMLIRNSAHGQALAKSLGDHPAVLMRGHGATVVGPSLPRLIGRAVFLVKDATLQQQAMALGGPIKYLNPEEARLIDAREGYGLARQWLAWKRQVGMAVEP